MPLPYSTGGKLGRSQRNLFAAARAGDKGVWFNGEYNKVAVVLAIHRRVDCPGYSISSSSRGHEVDIAVHKPNLDPEALTRAGAAVR